MEISHVQKKMDDWIQITILYILVTVITHPRFRTEVQNIKKGLERKPTKPSQNKDKMAIRKPHISIIALNVYGLNSPIKDTELQKGSKKTKPNHMLPPGDTSRLQRQIQTQSERMENDISSK